MRSVTLKQFWAWKPSQEFTADRMEPLAAGCRATMTAADFAALLIPVQDRLWCLLHEELIPAPALRLLACDYAERALLWERAAGREPDPRSWGAVIVARRYARGEASEAELEAAQEAAWRVWVRTTATQIMLGTLRDTLVSKKAERMDAAAEAAWGVSQATLEAVRVARAARAAARTEAGAAECEWQLEQALRASTESSKEENADGTL